MNVLEKILKEIDVLEDKEYDSEKYTECFIDGANCAISDVRAIIRRCMNDGKDTDTPTNNGWIPCSERLPNEEEYEKLIITDVHGNVYANVIYGYAEDEDKEPCFHEWDDEYWWCRKYDAIAWREYPEPYKPVETKPAKNTQQELEDFWRDK